jgi:TonB family protein
MSPLSRLTAVNDTFAVGRVLDEPDAFGIYYRGWDVNTEDQVVIREYAPSALARRDDENVLPDPDKEEHFRYGLEQFLDEAAILQRIDHENVAREIEHIENHGTAYRVLKRESGVTLRDGLERKGGALPKRAAMAILMPVLEGLEHLHEEGRVHAGVSPDSIFLVKSGRPVLGDARSAWMHLARRTGELQEALHPGYAAPEQYLADSRIGPWMDVYGCGAVLYHALSGKVPPTARTRIQDDPLPDKLNELDVASEELRQALQRIMALDPTERPASIEALRDLLDAPPEPKTSAAPAPSGTEEEPADAKLETDTKTTEPTSPLNEDEPVPAEENDAANTPADDYPVQAEERKQQRIEAELVSLSSEDGPARAAEHNDDAEGETLSSSPEEASASAENDEARTPAGDRPAQDPAQSAPPAAATEEADEHDENSRTWLYAAAAVLLLVLTGGGFFFIQGEDSAQAQPARNVILKRQGDSLFQRQQYEAARANYESALAVKPDDPYAKRRIAEAKAQIRTMNEQQFYARLQAGDSLLARGKTLRERGDSARGRKALEEANTKFLKALNNKPNDSLALARVQLVTAQLFPEKRTTTEPTQSESPSGEENSAQQDQAEAERKQEEAFRTQMFAYLRGKADSLFQEGEYVAARKRFREALNIKESQAVQQKLDEIDGLLGERKRDKQYAQHMKQGRRHAANGELEAAKAAFEQALGVKPDDEAAMRRVDAVKTQIVKRREQQKYEALRAQGEKRMKQSDYKAAIKSFREALEVIPNDSFARKQIAEAKRRQKEIQDARVDENGIYEVPDESPSLIGSLQDIYDRMEYPRRAYEERIEGQVFVRFVVNEEGGVARATVMEGRGLGYGANEEAKRVIKETSFEPATVEGEPVKAWHTIMLRFRLPDSG